jgi:putative membrane protein
MVIGRLLGGKKAAILLVAIGMYALCIESLAIKTSIPYGSFIYKDVLGNKVFGLTPWTVAFAYPPIVFLAYWYTRRLIKKSWLWMPMAAFTMMCVDLVLDPAAVRLGFWYWPSGGFFYGVPLVNFLGWLVTGWLGLSIVHVFMKRVPAHTKVGLSTSGLMITWFWTWVNVWLGHIWPCIIGFTLLLLFARQLKHKKGILVGYE